MMRLIAMLLMVVVLTGCRGRWEWVEEARAVSTCPGGRVDVERRTTDVINGRTRNTTVRTNACLE